MDELVYASERRQETILKLYRAAREQFAVHGVASTGVQAIVQAAGFSRGAFYSNFADPESFLRDFMVYEYSQIRAQISEVEALLIGQLDGGDGKEATGFPGLGSVREEQSAGSEAVLLEQDSPWLSVVQALRRTLLFDRDFVLVFTDLVLYAARHEHFSVALLEQHERLIKQVAGLVELCFSRSGMQLAVDSKECAQLLVLLFNSEFLHQMVQVPGRGPLSLSSQFLSSSLPQVLNSMVK